MTLIKIGGIALAVFLVIAQVFRIDMTNPPVEADVGASGQVKEAMKRSCYGCHSNETVWPWYSDVAPASWLVAYDVHQGRAALNFSSWGRYTGAQRLKMLKEISEEIADGEMPPFYYVYPMHMDARLSAEDQQAFKEWITSESATLTQQMSEAAKP
jgi:hypothetical protein